MDRSNGNEINGSPEKESCVKQLRQYQTIGIDKLAHKFSQGIMRIVFQLATGGGKTVTFAGLINRYLARQQKKVVILVHREELLKQACSTLFQWYGIAAAPVTASSNYLPNVMVYVAMVETANNRLKKNPNYFGNVGLLIVDECHIGNFKKLYEYFPQSLIIGFTATPISSSKKDPLKNHFKDIVCGIDIPELIEQGSLVPNRTVNIKNINRSELKMKNGEFDETQMGNIYSDTKHVYNTIAGYQQYGIGTKTLVFNCNIEHSKKVNEAFLQAGYNSRHLDGFADDRERKDTLAWFHNTPDAILNNVGILTTGFDEPSVQTVIINKATASVPLWLQMTGRGSRPYPGKELFTIIDMGSNAITHGDWCVSRDWSYMFFHPEKPKQGGVAPSKECVGCSTVIHASTKICRYCGADNSKKPVYDSGPVRFELLAAKKPIEINVDEVIAEFANKKKPDGTPYKDMAVLHSIKYKIIMHAKRVWRLKNIDDKTAERIIEMFQLSTKAWCQAKNRSFDGWLQRQTREWMMAEFKRVFDYEPKILAVA